MVSIMSDDDLTAQHRMLADSHNSKSSNQYDLFGEHMVYNVEASALHRKLQSKAEALRIMRKELEQFRTERDQFKLMAETLQLRYSAMRRGYDYGNYYSGLGASNTSVANLLHETREKNLKLTTELESLKQKLNELQGDIEVLRAGENRASMRLKNDICCTKHACDNETGKEALQWKKERAEFITHLERLKQKNAQLAFDVKTLIDEKEELITERDAYKCKAHRLNHELFVALKANETHPKFLDIDSIILENKYLQERLKNVNSELDLTKQSMAKVKSALESKRNKSIIKLSTSNASEENILTQKQVKMLHECGINLPLKTATVNDFRTLCFTLLDNMNDKNLALCHQKRTNRILATKNAELEQRIQTLLGIGDSSAESCFSPSQLLLHDYCPSLVDESHSEEIGNSTPKQHHQKQAPSSICHPPNEDSGTMSSEVELESNKTSCAVSDDGMSSLSTESGRSIISSEYAFDISTNVTDSAFKKTPLSSTTTDSGKYALNATSAITARTISSLQNSFISNSIARERMKDLADLPADLAALVQQALHELDMRDFDQMIVGSDRKLMELNVGEGGDLKEKVEAEWENFEAEFAEKEMEVEHNIEEEEDDDDVDNTDDAEQEDADTLQ